MQGFYAELGLTSLAIYADGTAGATRATGAPGIPTTLLVDAQGRELGRALGAKRWDDPEVIREIAAVSASRPAPAPTPK